MAYNLADVKLYFVDSGGTRTSIDLSVSGLTVASGFERDGLYLSLDPSSAAASMSDRVSATDISTYATALLIRGDRVDIEYDGATVLQGIVASAKVSVEVDPAQGDLYVRTFSYIIRGISSLMMDNLVEWSALPEEDPLERLQRWMSVDVSSLTEPQLDYIATIILEPEEEGGASYLELLRNFTAETGIPLRPQSEYPDRWDSVETVDTAIAWEGTPPTPVVTDADEWSTAVEFESQDAEPSWFAPTSLAVKENDTRFLGGFTTIPGYVSTPLGAFVLGTSLLGIQPAMSVGFQPGMAVDVFGTVMIVSRIAHRFGKTYGADIELAPPAELFVGEE